MVIVPTAAAFIGAEGAAIELSAVLDDSAKVEALMNVDRSSSAEPYFVERISDADLVVLCDGSPLHAKSVWHETPIGEALRAARCVIAIGTVASVLGDVMIDPRGGAPTTGLGYRSGLVIGSPASEEQLTRTRTLLGADELLAVVGLDGVVVHDGTTWRYVTGEVQVTRAHVVVEL